MNDQGQVAWEILRDDQWVRVSYGVWRRHRGPRIMRRLMRWQCTHH